MEGLDVLESVLRCLGGRDSSVARLDQDIDVTTVEGGEGVFESDSELPDDLSWVAELLLVFVLGQVLVLEPSAVVADVPTAAVVFEDLRLGGSGQRLLVQCVSDDLPQGVRGRPVLEHPLHVEIELSHLAPL